MEKLFWATRTGRWRSRLKREGQGPLERRLYRVICDDIQQYLLPAGAVLPTARRVATELNIDPGAVADAYRALQADGYLVDQPGKGLCIVDRDNAGKSVGDNTQVLFEKNLLSTARRAAAQGMSNKDASGLYRSPGVGSPGKP